MSLLENTETCASKTRRAIQVKIKLPRGLVVIMTYHRVFRGKKTARHDVGMTQVANPEVILAWTGRGLLTESVRFRSPKRVFGASGSSPKTALM